MQNNLELKSTRDAFGEVLISLGSDYEELVVVDADNATATRTAQFGKYFPTRFINVGVAEQNMVGVAAGLALTGKISLVATHAIFLCGRGYEQIRNTVVYGGLNVKLVGTHGGITVGQDGPTHFAFEDIALMRGLPGMTVVVPSDSVETEFALRAAINYDGPIYIRLGRSPTPVVNEKCDYFRIGKGVLMEKGNDIAIIACGIMVYKALVARNILREQGLNASVVNIHTIKPIDLDLVYKLAKTCGAIVVAEEHSIFGGLGSAVAEAVGAVWPVPIETVAVRDTFAESGDAEALLKQYHLTTQDIVAAASRVINRKK